MKLNKYYAEEFSRTTGIDIQGQHWVRNRKSIMEVIALEYLPNKNNRRDIIFK